MADTLVGQNEGNKDEGMRERKREESRIDDASRLVTSWSLAPGLRITSSAGGERRSEKRDTERILEEPLFREGEGRNPK